MIKSWTMGIIVAPIAPLNTSTPISKLLLQQNQHKPIAHKNRTRMKKANQKH
jgi:hypothetical protein